MLRLTLSRGPAWLDLGHGVRLLVEPLTTAVMLAARSDPAIVAAAATSESSSSNDYLTRIVAKAVARLVVQDWEGVGDEDGNPSPMTPEASTRFLNSGRSSRYSRPTTSLGRSSWMRKKRLTALAEWEFGGGGEYCAACAAHCSDCPRMLHAPLTLEAGRSGIWSSASADRCASRAG
jgi:hypothetical protein